MSSVKLALASTPKDVVALGKFLEELEKQQVSCLGDINVVRGADGVIYIETEYASEEDSLLISESMAEVSSRILMDMGVYIALASSVPEKKESV